MVERFNMTKKNIPTCHVPPNNASKTVAPRNELNRSGPAEQNFKWEGANPNALA